MGIDFSVVAAPVRGAKVTFLPEPVKRFRRYLIVSVDDHLIEPPTTFTGRIPTKFGDRGPHIVETSEGVQAWSYDGNIMPNVGLNAVVGRPRSEHGWEPVRFEDMRIGTWDPIHRLNDMDLNGVYASMSFPSFIVGFGGGRLQTITKDQNLALAAVRAFNDWQAEEWVGTNPDRLIACGVTWLHDPAVGAAEIRRNADRGFRALSFPEAPHQFGLPSIYSDYWEPILRACVDTGTVICLHIGSGGSLPGSDAEDASPEVGGVLAGMHALKTAVDWLYSGYPAKMPELKISLSEGGIGWLAGLIDRLDHTANKGDPYNVWRKWGSTPSEILLRNFYFCFLSDPKSLELRHQLGLEHIMFEVDYPHSDSSWPDSQDALHRQIGSFPKVDQERLSWRNAAELFGLVIPNDVQLDPGVF